LEALKIVENSDIKMDDLANQNPLHQDRVVVIIVLKRYIVQLFIAQGQLRISEPCMGCETVVNNKYKIFSGKFIFY
jgi:hypothetical protein